MSFSRIRAFPGIRQLALYVIFGICQLGIDWLAFVALTLAGCPLPVANVTSRLTAAVAGYLLNGYVTFKGSSRARLTRRALSRYVALWIILTLVSTVLIHVIKSVSDIETARIAKPLVEAILAAVSFVTMKYWVYRED